MILAFNLILTVDFKNMNNTRSFLSRMLVHANPGISRAKPCGFPLDGLRWLRHMMALRGVSDEALRAAVTDHPILGDAWIGDDGATPSLPPLRPRPPRVVR